MAGGGVGAPITRVKRLAKDSRGWVLLRSSGYAPGHVSLDSLLLVVSAAAIVARALFVAADAALGGVSPERADELRGEADTLAHRALVALKRDLEGTGFTTRGGAIAALAIAASLAGAASLHLL